MSGIKTFLLFLAVLTIAAVLSQAQSFTVIHNFSGAADGENPYAGPTLDTHGNLYGTTFAGGPGGDGTVYKLAPHNGSWIMHPLYGFTGDNDGGNPYAGVTIGPNGTLFGTTYLYGGSDYGTLFNLTPPSHACTTALCYWTDNTLHSFAGRPDGAYPYLGNVVFDSQGNLYGTTYQGGTYNGGAVYKATRSGGTWSVSVIWSLCGYSYDGCYPLAGVVLDSAGNLYGTTQNGGTYNDGTVFELSPSEGGWTETILDSLGGSQGCYPVAGLVFDQAGNLYGATYGAGYGGCATIFELSPQQGGGWNFSTLYTFLGNLGPTSTLAIDSAGNLYGTVGYGGTYGNGNVCKLSPSSGGWAYTEMYDFTGGNDGKSPFGSVVVTGPSGYLYGTTVNGGANGDGVIYQINLGAR